MAAAKSVPKTSKELDNAIEDDRRYKEVDSAKKRAVAQRVDYDTFKNLVSVAHLKPLQAPDEIVRVKGAPAWKFNALGVNEGKGKGDQKLLPKDEPFQPPEEQPKTSENFERVWKKSCRCSQDRYDFLLKFCTRETIKQIFKIELSSLLLTSIIDVLLECFVADDSELIFDLLSSLTCAGRFSLTVKFLGSKQKQKLKTIMDTLGGHVQDSDAMLKLSKDFGV